MLAGTLEKPVGIDIQRIRPVARAEEIAHRFFTQQEYMAIMTGVQRTTVSTLANAFKERGLIRYSRGNVEILDDAGLEAASCECARVVRRQFEDLEAEGHLND